MTPEDFINKIIGLPWVNRGEDFDGVDCWGLCILSFRKIDGVELPVVAGYADVNCSTGDAAKQVDMQQFTECQPSDGAIMCVFDNKANLLHVGRCLCGRVLHATKGMGVRHDTYRSINSAHRNVRYFKYD